MVAVCAAACASTPTGGDAPPAAAAQELLAAAEAAHHCSGEEAYDDARRAYLAQCVADNMATARRLLPAVAPASLPPGAYAAVRLFVDETLSEDDVRALCRSLPDGDFLPEQRVDDEVKLSRCAQP
jgi:hypothetical protein